MRARWHETTGAYKYVQQNVQPRIISYSHDMIRIIRVRSRGTFSPIVFSAARVERSLIACACPAVAGVYGRKLLRWQRHNVDTPVHSEVI